MEHLLNLWGRIHLLSTRNHQLVAYLLDNCKVPGSFTLWPLPKWPPTVFSGFGIPKSEVAVAFIKEEAHRSLEWGAPWWDSWTSKGPLLNDKMLHLAIWRGSTWTSQCRLTNQVPYDFFFIRIHHDIIKPLDAERDFLPLIWNTPNLRTSSGWPAPLLTRWYSWCQQSQLAERL